MNMNMRPRKLTEREQIALDMRIKLVALAKLGDAKAKAELMRLHGMRVYTAAEIRAFEGL